MVFVYGYVLPPHPPGPWRDTVRMAQGAIDQDSGSPWAVKNAFAVYTDDLSHRADDPNTTEPNDHIHLGTAGAWNWAGGWPKPWPIKERLGADVRGSSGRCSPVRNLAGPPPPGGDRPKPGVIAPQGRSASARPIGRTIAVSIVRAWAVRLRWSRIFSEIRLIFGVARPQNDARSLPDSPRVGVRGRSATPRPTGGLVSSGVSPRAGSFFSPGPFGFICPAFARVLRPFAPVPEQESRSANHATLTRLHADRAAGRHRHHRRPDRAAAAGRPGRPRGRPAEPVRQQPQAARARPAQLPRRRSGAFPWGHGPAAGTTGRRLPMLLPYMEQQPLFNSINFTNARLADPGNGVNTTIIRIKIKSCSARRTRSGKPNSLGARPTTAATPGRSRPASFDKETLQRPVLLGSTRPGRSTSATSPTA